LYVIVKRAFNTCPVPEAAAAATVLTPASVTHNSLDNQAIGHYYTQTPHRSAYSLTDDHPDVSPSLIDR